MPETINDTSIAFGVTPNTPAVRFIASLSDGRTVIQDDRPNHRHAWARLAEWMRANPDISITGIRLQGPNGMEVKTPPNKDGYFFGYKTTAVWGASQHNYTGVGYYDGHEVHIVWYQQPKFDKAFTEKKTVTKAGFFLIQNP